MAKYQYECELDGVFDYEFPIGTNPVTVDCKVCGDTANRRFTPLLTIFRGTGWAGKSNG